MAERLTDEKKKMIIAHYAESGSYKATAKCFGVADNTARRICRSKPEISQKVAQKRQRIRLICFPLWNPGNERHRT